MQLGAYLAGAAIEASMLGAAHATANPLTAHFGTVHGVAVGLMLPHVIRWNSPTVAPLYKELATVAGWLPSNGADHEGPERLAEGFTELLRIADHPVSLAQTVDIAVDERMIEKLAGEAAQQWTGHFNPRKMDISGFAALYRNAL